MVLKKKKKNITSPRKNIKTNTTVNKSLGKSNFYFKALFLTFIIFISFRVLFNDIFITFNKINSSIEELDNIRLPTKIYQEIERSAKNPLSQEEIDTISSLILEIYKNDVEKILQPLNEYIKSKE